MNNVESRITYYYDLGLPFKEIYKVILKGNQWYETPINTRNITPILGDLTRIPQWKAEHRIREFKPYLLRIV